MICQFKVTESARMHTKCAKKEIGGKNGPWWGPVGEENGPTCRIYIPAAWIDDAFHIHIKVTCENLVQISKTEQDFKITKFWKSGFNQSIKLQLEFTFYDKEINSLCAAIFCV